MNTRAITQNKKVVTFGEVMLRLTAPNFQRFSQTNEFIATYGGSEANVAISLVNFGISTEFVTRLPENAMAQACVNSLQAYGLGTDGIIYGGKRMGLYFLESGAAFRNSNVVYDREGSSFATLRPGMIDWEKILSDAGWFHWSGIAASLSQEGADTCLPCHHVYQILHLISDRFQSRTQHMCLACIQCHSPDGSFGIRFPPGSSQSGKSRNQIDSIIVFNRSR